QVNVSGGTADKSGSTEVMLDIEMVMAIANPTGMIIYTGPNSYSGALATYQRIADDALANQVSVSWGLPEQYQAGGGA
ncbi:pseudomonapepsin, partial [Acinetobacter baumannii]